MMFNRWLIPTAVALAACGATHGQRPSATTATTSADLEEHAAVVKRLDRATKLVEDLSMAIPERIEKQTRCAIVVPAMARGGVVIGAEHGKGFASCRTNGAWSAPAPITISGGTFGAQLGLEAVDVVMLTTTDDSMRKLLSSGLELGPGVSVAAGPVGKGREQATDATFRAEVVCYSRAEGLFAGADLAGAAIDVDTGAMRALYGQPREVQAVLAGRVETPHAARRFVGAIADALR